MIERALVRLSDVIVDIVETNNPEENNLIVYQEICPVSTRYIANKVSYTFKNEEIIKIYNLLDSMKDETDD